jgi:hypothetical protein
MVCLGNIPLWMARKFVQKNRYAINGPTRCKVSLYFFGSRSIIDLLMVSASCLVVMKKAPSHFQHRRSAHLYRHLLDHLPLLTYLPVLMLRLLGRWQNPGQHF